MTEPNRFDFRISALNGVHVAADSNGQYVRLTDYVALQQENAQQIKEGYVSVKKELLAEAAKLLRDIDTCGGLKQGGEQYPNGLNCHDVAGRLISAATVEKEKGN